MRVGARGSARCPRRCGCTRRRDSNRFGVTFRTRDRGLAGDRIRARDGARQCGPCCRLVPGPFCLRRGR